MVSGGLLYLNRYKQVIEARRGGGALKIIQYRAWVEVKCCMASKILIQYYKLIVGSLVHLEPKLCSLHSILDTLVRLGHKLYCLNRCLHWVELCMRIYMLSEQAKEELHTVTIKSNETVDKYYQRVFKLWKQAKTPKRERIKRFKKIRKPFIAHALIGQKHIKIMDMLDAAWEIKHKKSQISSKFPRKARRFQKPLGSLGRTWGTSRSLSQAGGSFNTEANLVAPVASGSFSAALRNNRKLVNTLTNANAKFIPTATKPAGWVGTWYNSKTNPKKLWDNKRATFLQQTRCWRCRKLGHCGSDKC